jgi:hypothetical protein
MCPHLSSGVTNKKYNMAKGATTGQSGANATTHKNITEEFT